MGSLVVPQDVTQNIARAKALFRRDEVLRGFDALILALDSYEPAKLMGRSRFEVEVLITECMQEVNRNPSVRKILEALTKSPKATVPYAPGGEAKLKALLPVLRKAIAETSSQKEQKEQEERELRKNTLRDFCCHLWGHERAAHTRAGCDGRTLSCGQPGGGRADDLRGGGEKEVP